MRSGYQSVRNLALITICVVCTLEDVHPALESVTGSGGAWS